MLAGHVPITQWAPQRQTFLNSVNMQAVIEHYCGANSVAIMPPTIVHKSAGMGCFAMDILVVGQVSCFIMGHWYIPIYLRRKALRKYKEKA